MRYPRQGPRFQTVKNSKRSLPRSEPARESKRSIVFSFYENRLDHRRESRSQQAQKDLRFDSGLEMDRNSARCARMMARYVPSKTRCRLRLEAQFHW